MARANLIVQTEVTEAFTRAQEQRNVRLFKVTIDQERLCLQQTINSVGSVEEDFSLIISESLLEQSEAAFLLYCLDDLSTNTTEGLLWLLITWIPDGCRVRDKMLYSSSIRDLKSTLGIGFFKSHDYAVSIVDDLSWKQYQESINREVNDEILTEKER